MAEDSIDSRIDVWTALERLRQQGGSKSATSIFNDLRLPNAPPGLDLLATLAWIYTVAISLVPGLDVRVASILGATHPSRLYRFLLLLAIPIVLLIIGRKRFGDAVAYLIFFPLVLILWKPFAWAIRSGAYRNAPAVLMLLDAATSFWAALRYHAISKTLAVLCVVIIFTSTSPALLMGSAATVLTLLAWSTVRVIAHTFRPSQFVVSQRKTLSDITKWISVPRDINFVMLADAPIPKETVMRIALTIMASVVGNRCLYLWASKLQEYRRSGLSRLLNTGPYAVLLVGAAAALFLLNFALFRISPQEFIIYRGFPSRVGFFLYSLSSLFFASSGGISATGDGAYLIAILAGLYGPSFLLTFAVNTVLGLRGTREDIALDALADELKTKARTHEETFRAIMPGGISAACRNFERLGLVDVPRFVSWIEHEIGTDIALGDERDIQ